MELIDADRVHELLDYEGLVPAIRKAHLGGMPRHCDRSIYEEPNTEGHSDSFIILPAWEPGEGILAKLVTSFPNNKARHGISNVNSIYVYINACTGVTDAVIDGEAVIFRKTSADSALGSQLLSREDADNFLIIGAGGLAPYLVQAHLSVRPNLKRIQVWNRTVANADGLVKLLDGMEIKAEVVGDLDTAVAEADIISSATMASEPHLKGKLLKSGVHIDLVGSFTREMRESDDDVMRRAKIFVDHRQTTTRSGEFLLPFERGVITKDDVQADYFELCKKSHPGRRNADEITLLKNGGGSHIDYYVTKYLMDRHHGREFSTICSS